MNYSVTEVSAVGQGNTSWEVIPESSEQNTPKIGLEKAVLNPRYTPRFFPRPCEGKVKIAKYDSRTGARLAGAQFTIYDRYNRVVQAITTDYNGVAQTTLPLGYYAIAETRAPAGYQLETTRRKINLCYSGQIICLSKCNVPIPVQKGCIQIIKKDESGKVLAGAVFDVYDSANRFMGTVTTNVNGIASLGNIPYGTYKIIEKKAPTGYALDSTPRYVTLSASSLNRTACITIFNKKAVGTLGICKKDEQGVKLAGAEFNVYDSADKLVKTVTTDSNGLVLLSNLPYGTYKVIETKAPVGYVLDSTPKYVTVSKDNPNGTVILTVINKKATGYLWILKKDEQGVKLSGAEFKIYDSANKLVKTVTTDSNGLIVIADLPYGTYKVVETKAPAGYILDSTPKYVTISKDNLNVVLTVTNKKAVGTLEITKKDEAGTLLSGAEFDVYDSTDKLVKTVTTDVNGVASLADLPYGTYKVVETKAPAGYILDSTPKYVTVSKDDPNGKVVLTVVNKKAVGTLEITKKDESGTLLSGAEFDVYDSTDKLVKTVTTDVNGVASLADLPYGTYKVVETKAPAGYILDSTPKYVTVSKDDPNGKVVLTVVNKKAVGTLEITKKDESGTLLSGAEFDVYDSKDKLVKTVTTDGNGMASLADLPYGTYKVVETKAPAGYILDSTPKYVTISKDDPNGVALLEIINKKNPAGTLKIIKYANDRIGDPTTIRLSGAEFEVVDSKGAVYNVVTDSNGEVLLTDLPVGTVTVTETKAPIDYKISFTPIQTTAIVANETKELVYYNDPIWEGRVLVLVSSSDSKLKTEGIEYEITGDNGEIYLVRTDELGQISMNLPVGEYNIAPVKKTYSKENYLAEQDILNLPRETVFEIEYKKLTVVKLLKM
ncbi:SpaA isopeptide-forming pilin-related protein [Enterococcus rivorum]